MAKKNNSVITLEKLLGIVDYLKITHDNYSVLARLILKAFHEVKIGDVTSYVPINNLGMLSNILTVLHNEALLSKSKPKFLDLGSSTGVMLSAAASAGFDAFGLEYHDFFVQYSYFRCLYDVSYIKTNLLSRDISAPTVKQGDMNNLATLKGAVKEMDLIYAWNPIYDRKAMLRVLANVVNSMKPGAKFIYFPAGTALHQLTRFGIKVSHCKISGAELYIKEESDEIDKTKFNRFLKTEQNVKT